MSWLFRTVSYVVVLSLGISLGCALTLSAYSSGNPQLRAIVREAPLMSWLETATGAAREALLPVRLEVPLSAGEASKANLFDEKQVMAVYERSAPAVVAIFSRTGQRQGLGSGVLIDPSGIVLTNYHVVRNATQIDVVLSDRTRYVGRALGGDPQNDLAVVRLLDAPGGLPVVPLGDLLDLKPGALAVAIGNPSGLERSVTVGVVSGLNRTLRDTPARAPIRDVIQTDAAINQGNSGGPLLNSKGEVIGINTAIEVVSGQRGFGGIGYAVPITTAKRYLDRMLAGETIEHAWLGISGSDMTARLAREVGSAATSGVFVDEAVTDSPADRAGLQKNDVLVSIGGQPVRTMDELGERLDRGFGPGDSIVLGVVRGQRRLELNTTLAKWPDRLPSR
jgi:S1-C subfamily serine protease